MKISPSQLKEFDPSNPYGCATCAWLKMKKGISFPNGSGLGAILRRIHKHFFDYLEQTIPNQTQPEELAGIKIIGREVTVKTYIRQLDFELWGYCDCIVQFPDKSYGILDLKTSQSTNIPARSSLQINAYSYCLEQSANHEVLNIPTFPKVSKLIVIQFYDQRFARNEMSKEVGVVGGLSFHSIRKDYATLIRILSYARKCLDKDDQPPCNPKCSRCKFYREHNIKF